MDSLQEEYIKAYYTAIIQRQREQEEAAKRKQQEAEMHNAATNNFSDGAIETPDRRVGMKAKREEEEDDDVEWEEAPPADDVFLNIPGNTKEVYKLHDLNTPADASGEDEDDIDWEEELGFEFIMYAYGVTELQYAVCVRERRCAQA
ncbi:hypothetical protein ACLOJK_008147 [Asimina triloba]